MSEPGFRGILGINGITAKYINCDETKYSSAKPLRPLRLRDEPYLPDIIDEGMKGCYVYFMDKETGGV